MIGYGSEDELNRFLDDVRREHEATRPPPAAPTPLLDLFARLVRGRVSSLRGLAAIAAGCASCLGPWPVVVWRCWTCGRGYTVHVVVSLLTTPVLFWALHLRGYNARVRLVGPTDPGPKPWQREEFPKPGTPEWGDMNRERAALIRRKVRGVASEGELIRLRRLQRESAKALAGG